MCAYADHALVLGKENSEVYAFVVDTMDFLTKEDLSVPELLGTLGFQKKNRIDNFREGPKSWRDELQSDGNA